MSLLWMTPNAVVRTFSNYWMNSWAYSHCRGRTALLWGQTPMSCLGKNKGVIGHTCFRIKAPQVHVGCPCHLLHLRAKYATGCLPWLLDIYWLLKHNAKRQSKLAAVKELYGVADMIVLKYCPKRWLSLLQCVTRLLKLWHPLRDFFDAECAPQKKSSDIPEWHERCKEFLHWQSARAYSHFLNFILELFNKANNVLQHEKPLIHKSYKLV